MGRKGKGKLQRNVSRTMESMRNDEYVSDAVARLDFYVDDLEVAEEAAFAAEERGEHLAAELVAAEAAAFEAADAAERRAEGVEESFKCGIWCGAQGRGGGWRAVGVLCCSPPPSSCGGAAKTSSTSPSLQHAERTSTVFSASRSG